MDPFQLNIAAMVTIDLDSSFFVQLGIVLAAIVVLKQLVFTPYLKGVEAREAKTEVTRRDADGLKVRADALSHEYAEGLVAARSEATEVRQGLRLDGLAAKDTEIDAARAEAAQDSEAASAEIAAEFAIAREALRGQVEGLSRQVVEKVLGA